MITKTEVMKAIADCEKHVGCGPLDMSLAPEVQRGHLHVLIEAARCAKYKCMFSGMDSTTHISNSHLALDND